MVSEVEPSMATVFIGRFTDVVAGQMLASSGSWDGIPGQPEPWRSQLRVEFHDDDADAACATRRPASGRHGR